MTESDRFSARRVVLAVVAGLVALSPVTLVRAVPLPLVNGDFESGTVGTGPPPGWGISSGNMYLTSGLGLSSIDPTAAYSGAKFLTASSWAPDPNASFPSSQRMGAFQVVNLAAHAATIDQGDSAVAIQFAYNDADNADNGIVTLQFLDGAANIVGFGSYFATDIAQSPSGGWLTRSLSARAPAGARSLRIDVASESVGSGTVRNVSFDAFAAELVEDLPTEPTRNIVRGNLIQFNPNGAWSWYQDERAIVDAENGLIVTGGVGNSRGFGGEAENSDIKATLFNLATGDRRTTLLHNRLFSHSGGDDHNTAAFLKLPNNSILSMYSGHNSVDGATSYLSYYRIYDTGTGTWSDEKTFNWNAAGHGGANFGTTYSNLFFLPEEGTGEGRIINIARSHERSPNFMYSDDMGQTWQYGGQLTTTSNVGYVNGYFKYVATGEDRIDFIATEHHPRDFNTSLYHGYIKDGKIFDSHDAEQDANIYDRQNLPAPNDFTSVFAANTVVDGQIMTRVWNTDIQTYDDGTITALFKARAAPYNGNANVDNDDHRVFYGRFDGASWTYSQLAKAGDNLYPSEQDYTGLGALHPANPDVVYISTEYHPETDTYLGVHEIFKGVTGNQGQTWSWTAITENSTIDNLRPIIPTWDQQNTALIWFRGDYFTQGYFDSAVVGIVDRPQELVGKVQYIDATTENTTLVGGTPLNPTTSPQGGDADNLWHLRTGFGNGDSVLTANETGSENALAIRTTASVLEAGTYDIFAYFWSNVGQDWMVQAALDGRNFMPFRLRGTQAAEADQFEIIDKVSDQQGDLQLFRAYLGRRVVAEGGAIEVFIDDFPTPRFDQRTWYDGIGLARVELLTGLPGDYNNDGLVNASDYVVWRNHLAEPAGSLPNDVDGGAIGSAQYLTWKAHFGQVAAGSLQAEPVPAPGGATLVGLICAACLLYRRGRTRYAQPIPEAI